MIAGHERHTMEGARHGRRAAGGTRKPAEEFFAKQNADAVAKLRATGEAEARRSEMAAELGVDDPELVSQLLSHGVTPAGLAAISLAPLILVAWSDRTLDDKERAAVLEEAGQSGITPASPGYELLQGWLNEIPSPKLMETWTAYAQGVAASLDATQRAEFRESIMKRARGVAKAAGGFAGINAVSAREKGVLEQIETALS